MENENKYFTPGHTVKLRGKIWTFCLVKNGRVYLQHPGLPTMSIKYFSYIEACEAQA